MKVCDKTCIYLFFPIINKHFLMAKRSLLSRYPSYALLFIVKLPELLHFQVFEETAVTLVTLTNVKVKAKIFLYYTLNHSKVLQQYVLSVPSEFIFSSLKIIVTKFTRQYMWKYSLTAGGFTLRIKYKWDRIILHD